eukprot:ANDGO_04782.mRNA.1 hypothetical protein
METTIKRGDKVPPNLRLPVAALHRSKMRGWLEKKSPSVLGGWQRRLVLLHESILFYYKSSTDATPAGTLVLSGARVVPAADDEADDAPLLFRIEYEWRSFLWKCASTEERDMWVKTLATEVSRRAKVLRVDPVGRENRSGSETGISPSSIASPTAASATATTSSTAVTATDAAATTNTQGSANGHTGDSHSSGGKEKSGSVTQISNTIIREDIMREENYEDEEELARVQQEKEAAAARERERIAADQRRKEQLAEERRIREEEEERQRTLALIQLRKEERENERKESMQRAARMGIESMCEGGQMVKFVSSGGKPHERFFQLASPDHDVISWGAKKGKKNATSNVNLADVLWVVYGPRTRVFKEQAARIVDPAACFSIVLKDRSIDLQAWTREQAEFWYLGLQQLLEDKMRARGRPVYSRGQLVFKRVVDRMRAEASSKGIGIGTLVAGAIRRASKQSS